LGRRIGVGVARLRRLLGRQNVVDHGRTRLAFLGHATLMLMSFLLVALFFTDGIALKKEHI
jgi:hypothetical protein